MLHNQITEWLLFEVTWARPPYYQLKFLYYLILAKHIRHTLVTISPLPDTHTEKWKLLMDNFRLQIWPRCPPPRAEKSHGRLGLEIWL